MSASQEKTRPFFEKNIQHETSHTYHSLYSKLSKGIVKTRYNSPSITSFIQVFLTLFIKRVFKPINIEAI